MNPCFRICCNTICSSCSLFHSFEVRKPIHLLRSKSPLIPVRKDLDARKFTPSKETEFERKSFLFSTRRDLTTGTCLTSHIMKALTIFLKKQKAENTFSFQQKELTATAMLNIPTTAIFSLAKKQKACPRSF